jgi:xanthine/uracil/vitamin C permease (AzgA family)
MSFGIYAVGTIILIAGLAYVAHLAHVPSQWIVAGAVIVLGAGIMGAVQSTRQKDPN